MAKFQKRKWLTHIEGEGLVNNYICPLSVHKSFENKHTQKKSFTEAMHWKKLWLTRGYTSSFLLSVDSVATSPLFSLSIYWDSCYQGTSVAYQQVSIIFAKLLPRAQIKTKATFWKSAKFYTRKFSISCLTGNNKTDNLKLLFQSLLGLV